MNVTIEIKIGNGREPTKVDIQKNIDALDAAIALCKVDIPTSTALLIDTKSILEGIKRELPR